MDLNQKNREADELIRKVVSRYNQLYSPTGAISQVELDLMLDDVRRMYDIFKQISIANLTQQPRPQSQVEINVVNPITPKPAEAEKPVAPAAPAIRPKPVTEAVVAEEPAQADFNESPLLEKLPEASAEKPVEIQTETAPLPAVETARHGIRHSTLADKFTDGNKSISQTMATPQGGLGSRVLQPIADLTTGINLHDKYSFIKELFNDDQLQYEEAIARVNKAVNYEEAMYILHKFHSTGWDENVETAGRIADFVKRRFV